MSIFLDEQEIPVFPYQFILVNDKSVMNYKAFTEDDEHWLTRKKKKTNTTALRNYTKSG